MLGEAGRTAGLSVLIVVGFAIASASALADEVDGPLGLSCASYEADADCYTLAASIDGNATGTVAASATGDSSGLYAASGTGDARGYDAIAVAGDAEAVRLAISGTGDADSGVLAASAAGESSSRALAVGATGDSQAAIAASGTGSTDAMLADVNGMNDADGCVAVSGTGEADGRCSAAGQSLEASGCETGRQTDTEEACRSSTERQTVAEALACDTDLASSDGQAHAWCGVLVGDCVQVIWGAAAGPVFVGGYDGCQAGVFYDEDGHEHAPIG